LATVQHVVLRSGRVDVGAVRGAVVERSAVAIVVAADRPASPSGRGASSPRSSLSLLLLRVRVAVESRASSTRRRTELRAERPDAQSSERHGTLQQRTTTRHEREASDDDVDGAGSCAGRVTEARSHLDAVVAVADPLAAEPGAVGCGSSAVSVEMDGDFFKPLALAAVGPIRATERVHASRRSAIEPSNLPLVRSALPRVRRGL